MNIFEEVKAAVPVPVAAEHYGLEHRNGMCRCIFHDDRTPSMKLYPENYYCFGCGAHGDVVALVAELFGLKQYDAAQKIAADFGIVHNSTDQSITQYKRTPSQREMESRAFRILYGYCLLLKQWRIDYAPKNENDELHPLFVESLTNLDLYGHYCDIFITGTSDERKDFLENGKEIIAYADSRNRNCTAERELIAV